MESMSLVGLDVHAAQTHVAVMDPLTGEARVSKLRVAPDEGRGVLGWPGAGAGCV
jgi:hypothetical protein